MRRFPGLTGRALAWFATALLALSLAGCGGGTPVIEPLAEPARPDPATVAAQALARGDYATAAQAYANLAASGDAAAPRHAALAALAYQDAGDYASAAALLGPADAPSLSPQHALARARALLAEDKPKEAYTLAAPVTAAELGPYERGVQARVSGLAALALGDFAAASTALTAAFDQPLPEAERGSLVEATWKAISRLPERELAARAAAGSNGVRGWYELALVQVRAGADPATYAQQIEGWRQRRAGHPATPLLETLAQRAVAAHTRPRRVALLLPFDDTLGVAATAVRDGFLTAWFSDPQLAERPAVTIYSTAQGAIAEHYARAVADGAEFVVGPLRKQLVEELKRAPDLPVGLLALNVVDTRPGQPPAPPGFYQFGLTPEDEALQVARHAQARGNRAIVLAPNNDWGRRLAAAYGGAWRGQGGMVLDEVLFSEALDAYIGAVRRALDIDASERRIAALRQRLGINVVAEPRRRGDIDAILLAAFPDNARQLLPQLRYYRADDIPVFSTSHVYGGVMDAERDIDLDGLVFGDMPWLFGAADVATFNLVRRSWPAQAASFARLYAFGIDAYRALPYLARLRQQPGLRLPGVTGDLWMDQDGVLHRNMTWMKFVNGIPTPTDTALPVRQP